MTDMSLDQRGTIPHEEWGGSHWVRRTLAVTFCLGLIVALVMVFTRVIAARIPEQRATLEKLITDRTGLAVRFDNVHFAWDLDGMNAVFTRVELTDPAAGRVRVVAPELRVEFDSWDFLRHQQFSLGHVTLSSPDIEIIGDPEEPAATAGGAPGRAMPGVAAALDEHALIRRYLAWAELMPAGRIEVEGARVHLLRRGQSPRGKGTLRHSFMLSQAVISRGSSSFNAHGTLLLAQDVGQSLFVSARLEGLTAGSQASGELRVIARRVFLDKLPVEGLGGRGTVDATFRLRNGRVESGQWQASARELEVRGDESRRFDNLSLNGTLARDGQDLVFDLTDLQLTRGARLERAPAVNVRVALLAGSTRLERARVRAARVPFMVAELMSALLPSRPGDALPVVVEGWLPTAGEFHDLAFDSGAARAPAAWRLSARVAGLEFTRAADGARLEGLAAQLQGDARELTLRFDPAAAASWRTARNAQARPMILAGTLALPAGGAPAALRFEEFSAASGAAQLAAQGSWSPGAGKPLRLHLEGLDRSLLQDTWNALAADRPLPQLLADIEQLQIEKGDFELFAAADGAVNWARSSAALRFAQLSTAGGQMSRLAQAQGALSLARGGARLQLDGGSFEGVVLRHASIEWPRRGAPRLHATLEGSLDAPLLRDVLTAQHLERLSGKVAIDAEARGERELRDPASWRVTARVSDARLPLGPELPAIEKLAGTMRYSAGQLRGVALAGEWLGGPLEVESRRTGPGGGLGFAVNGVADALPLLELLGQEAAARQVSGQFAWSGTAQPAADGQWKISLASNLGGLESRLPPPFDKARSRVMPVTAELDVTPDGVRDFAVESGRSLEVRGQVLAGVTNTHFEVQGISGELRHSAAAAERSELILKRLDVARAQQVLAVAGAWLSAEDELVVNIDEARYGARSLGALQATLKRQPDGVVFSLDSAEAALHQISARGECETDRGCHAAFNATTTHLPALLADARLPVEWPANRLHASGTLDWPIDAQQDLARSLGGSFEIQAEGASSEHQLTASATLADGQIVLADLQGTGPEPDQMFRGQGRIGLGTRDYEFTVDFERVSLAATAVPSPARARLARAWNTLRGSAARRGWTEAPVSRRVQWHGTWD